jgi:hypothetical protein
VELWVLVGVVIQRLVECQCVGKLLQATVQVVIDIVAVGQR